MTVQRYVVASVVLLETMAVRDGARDSEPERVDHQHHVLQDPIPTQDKPPNAANFHEIDWFKPTTWELKADQGTSGPKGVLADAVKDVGKAAQAMKIWAAEADTAMRNVDNEYISFKMQMDNQQQRADNLHATMKEEIMKKDQVRLKLMKEASLADGPTLHFNQNDIIEKNWHKDEPEQVYTLESLGLEDAQEAAELQDDRESRIAKFKEQRDTNQNEENTNDWSRLLNPDKPTRRAENVDSPFTVAGVQALKEKAERDEEELNCDNRLQEVCNKQDVGNTLCKQNPSFRDGCRLACGLCPNKELTKKFEKAQQNRREQEYRDFARSGSNSGFSGYSFNQSGFGNSMSSSVAVAAPLGFRGDSDSEENECDEECHHDDECCYGECVPEGFCDYDDSESSVYAS